MSEAQFILDVEGLRVGACYESQCREGGGEMHDCFVNAVNGPTWPDSFAEAPRMMRKYRQSFLSVRGFIIYV